MEKGQRNVIVLGIAFMLFLASSQTVSNILKIVTYSIEVDDSSFHANAYYSQAVCYGAYSVFIWTSPSVITVLTPKFSMCLGNIFFLMFIVQLLLIPATWTTYIFSVLMGFGGPILWTSQGIYFSLNSTERSITRNSGIFYSLINTNMIIGNVFIMLEFKGKEEIDKKTRTYVLSSLAALGVIAMIVFFTLPKIHRPEKDIDATRHDGPKKAFVEAVKLLLTPNMLLLNFTFLYLGLEQGFFTGIYSSCLGFTKKLQKRKELVGVSGIFIGIGQISGGIAFSLFANTLLRWKRGTIVMIGCLVHILAYCLIFINLPKDSPFFDTEEEAIISSNRILAIFCSFLLGIGDCIFSNIVIPFLGTAYADNSGSAFAVSQFCMSIGSVITFITASALNLYYQLAILSIGSIIAIICFMRVEFVYNQQISKHLVNKGNNEKLSCDSKDQLEKY